MKLTPQILNAAVEQGIIDRRQADRLLALARAQQETVPRFTLTHVLYYFGGLIAIAAMALFMLQGWEALGGWGLFGIAAVYALASLGLAIHFERRQHIIPAGICATFALSLTPLAVYGLQQALGWWPGGSADHFPQDGRRLYMELASLVAAALLIYRFRFPFLLMPLSIVVWCLAIDLVAILWQVRPDFELRALVSMHVGLVMILAAFWVDIRARGRRDFSFWLYLFGVLAFWCGLTAQDSRGELSKLFYFLINLGMIGIGAILLRRVFVVFGALGSFLYLGHLASTLFEDSWLFPLSLAALGLLIVWLGVLWQKNQHALVARLQRRLPRPLRELLVEQGRG